MTSPLPFAAPSASSGVPVTKGVSEAGARPGLLDEAGAALFSDLAMPEATGLGDADAEAPLGSPSASRLFGEEAARLPVVAGPAAVGTAIIAADLGSAPRAIPLPLARALPGAASQSPPGPPSPGLAALVGDALPITDNPPSTRAHLPDPGRAAAQHVKAPAVAAPLPVAAAPGLADAAPLPSAAPVPDAAPLSSAPQTPLLREAPTSAPAGPAPGAAPSEPAQQIVRAIVAAPGERMIEVRLDPPSLGRVRIEFDFSGDAVRAVVSATEPEALSLLRRSGAGLARELAEMGYPEVDIEYAEDRSDRTGGDAPAGRAFALPVPDAGAASAAAPARAVRLHDGALDITL